MLALLCLVPSRNLALLGCPTTEQFDSSFQVGLIACAWPFEVRLSCRGWQRSASADRSCEGDRWCSSWGPAALKVPAVKLPLAFRFWSEVLDTCWHSVCSWIVVYRTRSGHTSHSITLALVNLSLGHSHLSTPFSVIRVELWQSMFQSGSCPSLACPHLGS